MPFWTSAPTGCAFSPVSSIASCKRAWRAWGDALHWSDLVVLVIVYSLTGLGVTDVKKLDETVEGDPGELPVDKLAAALVTADVRIHGFGLERPSLEDAFVALTGEGFDVSD